MTWFVLLSGAVVLALGSLLRAVYNRPDRKLRREIRRAAWDIREKVEAIEGEEEELRYLLSDAFLDKVRSGSIADQFERVSRPENDDEAARERQKFVDGARAQLKLYRFQLKGMVGTSKRLLTRYHAQCRVSSVVDGYRGAPAFPRVRVEPAVEEVEEMEGLLDRIERKELAADS
ncbi:hypothetical protein EPO33_04540 [Patescibacteria group bacterium]|nr:MAG: hypothetical protein EPO33_04540 [Patescibacteria group bacterium]